MSLTWLPFLWGGGGSSPPNVKKNKVSLCSACFNNFHKFSSEIKNCHWEGKKRRKGTDGNLGPRRKEPQRSSSIEISGRTEMHRN